MEIEYLKELQKYPKKVTVAGERANVPISEQEIETLEQAYCNDSVFPKVLKELLFLAGGYCYVLAYGSTGSQQGLQDFVRTRMQQKSRVLSRPFYVIDVYNIYDQFLFVYLDEGDDPKVQEGFYEDDDEFDYWHHTLDTKLSSYIIHLVERVKKGESPF